MLVYVNERPTIHDEVYRRLRRMVVYDDYFNEILHSNLIDTTREVCDELNDNEKLFVKSYYDNKMRMKDIVTAIKRSPGFVYTEHYRLLDSICAKIINKTIGVKESFEISYLNMSDSLKHRLILAGYNNIGKVANATWDEISGIGNFGPTKINALVKALEEAGINHNIKKITRRRRSI